MWRYWASGINYSLVEYGISPALKGRIYLRIFAEPMLQFIDIGHANGCPNDFWWLYNHGLAVNTLAARFSNPLQEFWYAPLLVPMNQWIFLLLASTKEISDDIQVIEIKNEINLSTRPYLTLSRPLLVFSLSWDSSYSNISRTFSIHPLFGCRLLTLFTLKLK